MTPTYRTMTARFAGTCRRCSQPIAVGQQMRWGGKGLTYHLAADCAQASTVAPVPAAVAVVAPVAPTSDRQLMSASIAASLAQTFASLLARPARMHDMGDEPIDVEAGDEGPAVVDVPAEPALVITAHPGVPVAVVPVAQSRLVARQAARRATIAPVVVAQPAGGADWF